MVSPPNPPICIFKVGIPGDYFGMTISKTESNSFLASEMEESKSPRSISVASIRSQFPDYVLIGEMDNHLKAARYVIFLPNRMGDD